MRLVVSSAVFFFVAAVVAAAVPGRLDVQLVEDGVLVPERVVAHGLPLRWEPGPKRSPARVAPGGLVRQNSAPRALQEAGLGTRKRGSYFLDVRTASLTPCCHWHMADYQQSREELEGHLADQLQFLQSSADAFDRGFDGEAKRLALALRILLHEHKKVSRALLGQLGLLGQQFVSTAIPHETDNISSHGGLIMVGMKGPETSYIAMLDEVPVVRKLSFDEWWNEIVFVDVAGATHSRRELVLSIADQDGGAHVDPTLNETYARLSRENGLGWTVSDGSESKPIPKPERAAVRQIAHEVLRTLIPAYSKYPLKDGVDMFFGGMMHFGGVPPGWVLPESTKLGRNDPCYCGSGVKYKKCHGRSS